MSNWDTVFKAFLLSQHRRIGNQSVVPELADEILKYISEEVRQHQGYCACCNRRTVLFSSTYKPPPSEEGSPLHLLRTKRSWEQQFADICNETPGGICTKVPGILLGGGAYDIPICQFFQLHGVRWTQIYTRMLASETGHRVELSDDFVEMFEALKIVQTWSPQ